MPKKSKSSQKTSRKRTKKNEELSREQDIALNVPRFPGDDGNYVVVIKDPETARRLCHFIEDEINSMKNLFLGRMLTVTDGMLSDTQQRKAVKDIVREMFWGEEHWSDRIKDYILNGIPSKGNHGVKVHFNESYRINMPKSSLKE